MPDYPPGFTPDPKPEPAASEVPPLDAVGRAKAALTAEPPAGERHGLFKSFGPDLGPVIRGAGRALLPGSWQDVAGQAAMAGVPGGSSALKTIARVAAPAAAGMGVALAKGEDPTTAALEQGAGGLGGVVTGGLAKSGARALGSAFDKTEQGIGKLIAKAIPEFAGDTPQETIKRILSGEGPAALQRAYKQGVEEVIKEAGDPGVLLPSLGKLYPQQPMAAWRASEAMTLMDSLNRSLKTASGGTSRRKMAQVELDALSQAEQELTAQLQQHLPPEARGKLRELDAKYYAGKAIQRWFGAGKEQLTDARVGKLIQKGAVNVPELQKAYLQREGELGKALPPAHAEALKRILRRGETNPLALDQPAKAPHLSFFGLRPHPTSLPHAPVRVGTPEVAAEGVARSARQLGQRAVQETVDDDPVR